MTINKNIFEKYTTYFGCNKDCNNLNMVVCLEFDCSHPPQATSFIKEVTKGQKNYEVSFNSENEKCRILIFPEEINLSSNKIQRINSLDELEKVEE